MNIVVFPLDAVVGHWKRRASDSAAAYLNSYWALHFDLNEF